jgi:hypothetical protein
VSPDLRAEIDFERGQVSRLLQESAPLLTLCRRQAPDAMARAALASILHSFYTGVENLFKRIATATGETLPTAATWHRDLLTAMSEAGPGRPAVISEDARAALRPYLAFRHAFRHAYTFDLQWDKMQDLVLALDDTWRRVDAELAAFCDAMG